MANTILLASGTTAVWGADGVTQSYGTVKTYTEASQSKEKVMPGSDGSTAALVKYDKSTKGTLEVYAGASATLPAVGETISVGGISGGVVDSAREVWSAEDFKLISIEITKYDSLGGGGGG